MLGYQSPLYGRRTGQFKIEPLTYKDKAEAILNAASNMIKEKMEENPAFYEKLSEKIKRDTDAAEGLASETPMSLNIAKYTSAGLQSQLPVC